MERSVDWLKARAFEFFFSLKPGEEIVISKIARRNPKQFVEFAKEFIDNGGFIEFSPDYRKIRGLDWVNWPELKREDPGPYLMPE